MDEFHLIQKFFNRVQHHPLLAVGIGDDCAVVASSQEQWLISIDTMVEGVHFPADAQAYAIGTRALAGALSDLAAMGAKAQFFTLALTLPHADAHWLEAFSSGLFAMAAPYNCVLAGGDTTRGPLCISIQVHGTVAPGRALMRSGANAGDRIFVSGPLGDGAAALAMLQRQLNVPAESSRDYLLARFYEPQPQLLLGQELLGVASACIDISDGLVADLTHICKASGLTAVVDVDALPLSDTWSALVNQEQGRLWALTGGDDYQLLFCVPEAKLTQLQNLPYQVAEVGRMQALSDGQATVQCINAGKAWALPQQGYKHFA